MLPRTLPEAVAYFADPNVCNAHLRALKCKRSDTIFSRRLGLDKWFVAVWGVANCKRLSGGKLADVLGITEKSASFMLNRVKDRL